jgi:hypothetical protein
MPRASSYRRRPPAPLDGLARIDFVPSLGTKGIPQSPSAVGTYHPANAIGMVLSPTVVSMNLAKVARADFIGSFSFDWS